MQIAETIASYIPATIYPPGTSLSSKALDGPLYMREEEIYVSKLNKWSSSFLRTDDVTDVRVNQMFTVSATTIKRGQLY